MEIDGQTTENQGSSVKNNKGKKKFIPWRDPEKGSILKAAMFNLALTSSVDTNKIYIKVAGENRKVEQRWEDFHKVRTA